MATLLEEIVAYKRQVVSEALEQFPLEEICQLDESAPAPPSFPAALAAGGDVAIIAEIKKASPSKGLIRADFDPVAIAEVYEANGASAISVLTDEKYFQGCADYLTQVSNVVDIPVLRKDFVIDTYQIYEARAIGAAALLLITAILEPEQLGEYRELCDEIGLDALIEVHTQEEVAIALESGAEIIGINNRDLHTFETDLNTTTDLIDRIPEEVLVVTESGIHSREDVVRLRDAGVNALLVGECLMREPDIGRKLRELLGEEEP
jgi:indole-3-glycerol phosphate synthase